MADVLSRALDVRALTIWQPWAHAIAHLGKSIENRQWMTHHRGPIAIHAAASAGTREQQKRAVGFVARLGNTWTRAVQEEMEIRGAVVAVARLTGVCSKSLRYPSGRPLACDCGLWAFSGERHFRLADVRALPEPVPCRGAQKLWQLPDDVYEAILPTAKAVLHG
ncbi:hypothetical protein [Actinomadura sp. WMMA1423]|uniref:hypothetical protein n=1 Tax=Actinomadura sp. WMMA1423 TaxID=2591108 RepID=UPI0011471DA6|nr:hypothetical protein [Actinomadura sp. WMMA1423]